MAMPEVHEDKTDNTARQSTQAGKNRFGFLVVALIVVVSTAAGFAGGRLGVESAGSSKSVQQQQVVLKTQGQLISSIAQQVGKSVVSVEVKTTAANPFAGLFGFGGNGGTTVQESAGTGIILTADGLIITNRHVVPASSSSVSVTLSDGTTYDNVDVVGRTSTSDPLDIAFLKIKDTKGKKLSPATIGDSAKMEVGDPVVAIGNALGQLQNTVTSGIISGFGRSVQASDGSGAGSENLQNLFQTDAAINEGNSGGPLVNLEGEVIGINTAIAGNAQSIGFAIPTSDIKGMIASVKASGKLERPYLGVVYISVTPDVSARYNLGVNQGAYIPSSGTVGQDSVVKGGPADKAGVHEGDVITKVNGQAIDDKHSLTSLLSQFQPDDKVTLTIRRDAKSLTLDVTLGTLPQ